MVRLISRQRGGLAALKRTKLFGINDFPAAKDSGKVFIIIIYCYLIIIIIIIINSLYSQIYMVSSVVFWERREQWFTYSDFILARNLAWSHHNCMDQMIIELTSDIRV